MCVCVACVCVFMWTIYKIVWPLSVGCLLLSFYRHRQWNRTLHWIDSWTRKCWLKYKLKSDNTWELVSFLGFFTSSPKKSIPNASTDIFQKYQSIVISWFYGCVTAYTGSWFTSWINDSSFFLKLNPFLMQPWFYSIHNKQLYDLMIDNACNNQSDL